MACISEGQEVQPRWPEKTTYRKMKIDGQEIFYREAGKKSKPTLLLLHGYPSSSHTYRELIPLLSGYFHVISPDNLGSGFSSKPDPKKFLYDFDVLADWNLRLLKKLKVEGCYFYMQDFGAPVGFRMMRKNPDRVLGVIAQNANAYLEGIPPKKQAFFRKAQEDKSPENQSKLYQFTGPEAIKHKQYLRDVKGHLEVMSPDSWSMDNLQLDSDKERRIQVKLFQDYKTNLVRYTSWQKFMRKQQYPTLLVWGKKDPVFTEAGARAYLKDVPNASLKLLDAGHFAVEEKPVEVAKEVIRFILQTERDREIPKVK